MGSALDNAELKRLARTILKNPSASARKAALLDIRKSEHPQVLALLERVVKDDKDAEVRDLASNILSKRRIETMLEEGTFEDAADISDLEPTTRPDGVPPPMPPDIQNVAQEPGSAYDDLDELQYHTVADDSAWTCRFCDTNNIGGHYCDSCGAHRGDTDTIMPPDHRRPALPIDDNIFLLHTTNRKVLTGKKQATFTFSGSGSGCIMLFMVPFILAGLVVGYFAVKDWQEYQLLQREGITVSGNYVSRRYDNDDDGTTYYVAYQFYTGDRTYQNEHSVNQALYNRVEPGAPVQVIYALSNPTVSRIDGTQGISTAIGLTVFTVFWNLISWGVFLGMFISNSRDKRLSREGQWVRGELLAASGRRDSDGDFQLKVEYSFVAPDMGQVIFKTESAQRNDLKNGDLPEKGTPIGVLYRNPNHFRML